MSPTTQLAAQALVRTLEAHGVRIAFGLPGVHNLPIWDALEESSIRLVGVRHEQTTVYAADGHARVTGELGVAVMTTGPGAANALGATGEAWTSHSPVLVIATDIPASIRRQGVYRGALHETRDQAAMFAPVVKQAVRVSDPSRLGELTSLAVEEAMRAPSGPVYLEIPTDLLGAPFGSPPPESSSSPNGGSRQIADPRSDTDLRRAVAICEEARRPLLWVGGGAGRAGAGEQVARLAERLGAPVIETHGGRGTLRPKHPCWVGLPPHIPEVGALWDEADLVVSIGSDLDGISTQNWAMPQPPRLIALNVDSADAAKNYSADAVIEGDVRDTLPRLCQALEHLRERSTPLPELTALREAAWRRLEREEPAGTEFLSAMAEVLGDDTIVFADMCIPGYWLAAFHPFSRPRRLAVPLGWGTLGFAFPASIGPALSQPDPVLCVCGDGGFLMACGELAAVAQERAPLTVMLVDDGGYGMLRHDRGGDADRSFGVDLQTPDWLTLAGAFGIVADEVSGFGASMRNALRRHLALPEPSLLAVRASLPPPPFTSPRWYRNSPPKRGK